MEENIRQDKMDGHICYELKWAKTVVVPCSVGLEVKYIFEAL